MSYAYRIRAENQAGLFSDYIYSDPLTTIQTNTVISHVSNYPNPFNSRRENTNIFYYLNQDTGIEIRIYDSMGHFVRKYNYTTGTSGKSLKGDCSLEWDGKNEQGEYVAKGGYFVVIEAPEARGDDRKVVRMVGVIH
jgi:flagellar hook assembly protein FlgD